MKRFVFFFIHFIPYLFSAQTNFLKYLQASSGYSFSQQGYPVGLDTMGGSSFLVSGGSAKVCLWPDTLCVDGYILKNSVNGQIKWLRKYHFNNNFLSFNDLSVMKDKTILVSGNSYSSTSGGNLMKADSNGTPIWFRQYPLQEIYHIKKLKDGDIAVFASDSGNRIKIVLMSSSGSVKWCKKQTSPSNTGGRGYGIVEGKDKHLVFYGNNMADAFTILTDSLGNIINDFKMNNNLGSPDYFWSGLNFYDSGYMLCGTGMSPVGSIAGNIVRLDNGLNLIWHKKLITNNSAVEFMDIKCFSNNNILIGTEPEGHGASPNIPRMGLAILDSNGVSRKELLFSSDTTVNYLMRILPLKNGSFAFAGFGNHIPNTMYSHFFGVKDTVSTNFCGYKSINSTVPAITETYTWNVFTCAPSTFTCFTKNVYVYQNNELEAKYECSNGPNDPQDPLPTNLKNNGSAPKFSFYPNPAENLLILNLLDLECTKISIVNIDGSEIYTSSISPKQFTVIVDTSLFPNGVYAVKIIDEDGFESTKKLSIFH